MKTLLTRWDAVRIIRLLLGLGAGGYALYIGDHFLLALGGIFVLQAVLNWSCCGAGGCGTKKSDQALYQDVIKPYEPKRNS